MLYVQYYILTKHTHTHPLNIDNQPFGVWVKTERGPKVTYMYNILFIFMFVFFTNLTKVYISFFLPNKVASKLPNKVLHCILNIHTSPDS